MLRALTCATIIVARNDDTLGLAEQYGRYGYRMIAEWLRAEGWRVHHKKVERLWREEGFAPIHVVAIHPVDVD